MLRIFIIGCTCLFFSGCIGVHVDRLPEETAFREIHSIPDICGAFKNQGTSHKGNWSPLLSDTFFPENTFSEAPSVVRISNRSPSVLTIEAISQGNVLASLDLEQDQDFHLVDGTLKLEDHQNGLILNETGAGVATGSTVIRLTDAGNAVLTQRGGGVGLMLFIVPMAISESQDAVFERIKEGESTADGSFQR